jgi:hypothetical protein
MTSTLPEPYTVGPAGPVDLRLLPLLAAGLTVRTIGDRLRLAAPRGAPEEVKAEVRDHADDFRRLLDLDPLQLARRLLAAALCELSEAGRFPAGLATEATRAADARLDQASIEEDPAAWLRALVAWRSTWLQLANRGEP